MPCPDIDKQTFRIFDAVDLYAKLQNVSEMKPVVVNPQITFGQLFEELVRVNADDLRAEIRDQIIVKLRRQLTKLDDRVTEIYAADSGETPAATLERLRTSTLTELADWMRDRPQIGQILDWNPDRVIAVTRGYGSGQRPDDFLDSFTAYVRDNVNQIAALTVVLQRPRELTRAQLRELRLELDRLGYSDTNLRQAWQDAKNEDIAASIVGFIRQAALGDPLIPYDERVKVAMKRISVKRYWTEPQRKWLQRIGEQVAREFIVDREALDREPFKKDGGFDRLNRVFDGQLEAILGDINEELWRQTG